MNDYLRSDLVLSRFLTSLKDYAIIILDKDGRIANWNTGAKALNGYSQAEIIGRHFSIFHTPEAQEMGRPETILLAAVATGRHEEESWRVKADGSRYWAHALITPIYDEMSSLIGFGKVQRDISARRQATEQSESMLKLLEFAARTDYLTGLDNRRSFDRKLTAILSAARRHGRVVSLALIDLDRFKGFNDECGHQAGDRYLKLTSQRWQGALREEDVIARYGGDEFVVILPDTKLAGAITVMERLSARTPQPLTCSIGLAEWDGLETGNQLIDRADRTLYGAKAAGRNRVLAGSEESDWKADLAKVSPSSVPA